MARLKRKSHTKTRSGCGNCKRRKVKCDESKPACGNCGKRDLKCDFLGLASPSGKNATLELNVIDLELLHNYTTIVYRTLSEDTMIREFYRISVVQIGFGNEYIMRAILAISGLHLAHQRPRLMEHYTSVAMLHHQAASSIAIPLISDVSAQEAQMLFLFSVLTTFYALACPRKGEDRLLLGEPTLPAWVFLLRGMHGFIEIAGVPEQGILAPLFKHAIARFMVREGLEHMHSPAHEPLADLETFIRQQSLTEDHMLVYVTSIKELKKSFSQLEQSGITYEITDAFTWMFIMAEDLLPLLRDLTPESVAIFAFFCVLLKKLDGHWWIQGWGQHLIARAYALLDDSWRLRIRWPLEEIGWIPQHDAGQL